MNQVRFSLIRKNITEKTNIETKIMTKYLLLLVVIVGLYFNKDSLHNLTKGFADLINNRVDIVAPISPKETQVEDGYIVVTKRQVLSLDDGIYAIQEGEIVKIISVSPLGVYVVSHKGMMFEVEEKHTSLFHKK